MNHWHLQRHQG